MFKIYLHSLEVGFCKFVNKFIDFKLLFAIY